MRHITPARLDALDDLLADLRLQPALKEKKRGVFYRKSRAFLHFHEDGEEIYADLRIEGLDFDRYRCTSKKEQKELLKKIRSGVNGG